MISSANQGSSLLATGKAEIRLLTTHEACLVAELEALCFPDAWDAERIAGAMHSGLRLVGAFAEGQLVGYLSYRSAAGEAEIVNLAVYLAMRRQGFGRQLLAAALQKWHEDGVEYAYLEVRASNVAAKGLYMSSGFIQVGQRTGYYADTGEDALVLRWSATMHPPKPRSGS
jgi:ribosomal-protein-alanine N-acetyltransferase